MHTDLPYVQAPSRCYLQADWQEQETNTEVAEPISRAVPGLVPPQRGVSDASALISHFDDWANVLDGHEVESSLSRRGSGKLEGLEPDALRNCRPSLRIEYGITAQDYRHCLTVKLGVSIVHRYHVPPILAHCSDS